MEKDLYVLVDKDLHELWLNEFGGELPPMTKRQLCYYFLGAPGGDNWKRDINKKYARTRGIPEDSTYIKFYKCTEQTCPHCGYKAVKSDLPQYKYQCFYCDEDFYECEVK